MGASAPVAFSEDVSMAKDYDRDAMEREVASLRDELELEMSLAPD